jgi:hypothetical protein
MSWSGLAPRLLVDRQSLCAFQSDPTPAGVTSPSGRFSFPHWLSFSSLEELLHVSPHEDPQADAESGRGQTFSLGPILDRAERDAEDPRDVTRNQNVHDGLRDVGMMLRLAAGRP